MIFHENFLKIDQNLVILKAEVIFWTGSTLKTSVFRIIWRFLTQFYDIGKILYFFKKQKSKYSQLVQYKNWIWIKTAVLFIWYFKLI